MIDKLFFWNIRSVRTQKAFERLIDLNKKYQYSFISLIDPFQEVSKIDQYVRRSGFINAFCNSTSKM